MDWMLTWALAATVTALWFGLSYRRERARVAFWRSHSREWCDRYFHDTEESAARLEKVARECDTSLVEAVRYGMKECQPGLKLRAELMREAAGIVRGEGTP